ncbi:Collagen alpha-4(VI) chain, partial [Colletotrichum sp. SAR 10_98]
MHRVAALALLGQVVSGQLFTNSSTVSTTRSSTVLTSSSTTVITTSIPTVITSGGSTITTAIPITETSVSEIVSASTDDGGFTFPTEDGTSSEEFPTSTESPSATETSDITSTEEPTSSTDIPSETTGTDSTSATGTDSTSATGTETTATGTETSTGTDSTSTPSATVAPNPQNVGGFTFLGCFGSPSSFPTFDLTLSAESMTIDRCIAACPAGKRYAALFGNDCFCGDFVDDVNEVAVSDDECNIPCGGNPTQRCGGRASEAVLKRQIIAATIRFTIYVRVDGASGTGAVTTATVTTTFTVTTTGTAGTGIEVVTTTYCPVCADCQGPFCYKPKTPLVPGQPCWGDDCYKKLVCYGDWCTWDYPCYGDSCGRRLVWENDCWKPEVCHGDDCGRKVICSNGNCEYATCNGSCNKEKIICYGDVCKVEECEGDECNK